MVFKVGSTTKTPTGYISFPSYQGPSKLERIKKLLNGVVSALKDLIFHRSKRDVKSQYEYVSFDSMIHRSLMTRIRNAIASCFH